MPVELLLHEEDLIHMASVHLSSPVTDLYGIGPSAEEKLAKLDIFSVYDLIAFIPWRYDDWSNVGTISSYDASSRFDDNAGFDLSFRGTVSTNPSVNVTSRKKPLSFFVSDGTGRSNSRFSIHSIWPVNSRLVMSVSYTDPLRFSTDRCRW